MGRKDDINDLQNRFTTHPHATARLKQINLFYDDQGNLPAAIIYKL